MKLTQYIKKRVRVTASYHPMFGTEGLVVSANRRTRKLTVYSRKKPEQWTAHPNELEVV